MGEPKTHRIDDRGPAVDEDVVPGTLDALDLGYELLVCHACARYIKERQAEGMHDPIVERVLTVDLDAAAERRGLRI